ncbi:MAG: DMT family transporter [Albidovulum sp.]|uniref:DMT family transporter n=1 Tax=Albidovulum sp. TaxID=1872424 RepID=UPI003C91F418
MAKHPLYGLGLAAFGALILTPDTLLMRWSGMDGFSMLAWRGLLMGTLLVTVWLFTARKSLKSALPALFTPLAAGIVLSHGANAAFFSLGIAVAPVAIVLFGVATMPVFAAIFSRMIAKETTSRGTWIATAAVMAGIALAVFGDGGMGLGLNLASLYGALAGLAVAATLALGFTLIRRSPELPILPLIGSGAFLAGLIGLAAAPEGGVLSGNLAAIAITGAVILPVSFLALTHASRHTHAANVSLLMLLETVLGPAWVWAGTGEAMTPVMIAGGGIVVGSLAIYILVTARQRRAGRARAA